MNRTAQIEIEMMIADDEFANPHDYLFQDPVYQLDDQERLDTWRHGDWRFVGIRAKARIKIPHGTNPDCWIISELVSPGLWGVASDAGDGYFQEVYQEERDILQDMLASLRTAEIHA